MATLTMTLDGIYQSQWPMVEKKRLAAMAVRYSLGPPVEVREGGSCGARPPVEMLEEALSEVQHLACLDKRPSITDAKTLLRRHGQAGTLLASRLSRLSKARNCAAHPDVSLLKDLGMLFNGCSTADDYSVGGGSSSRGDSTSDDGCSTPATGEDEPRAVQGEAEELEELSSDAKAADRFLHARIEMDIHGQLVKGLVEDVEIGKHTRDRLYRVRYDDGDVEHLTAEKVMSSLVTAGGGARRDGKRGQQYAKAKTVETVVGGLAARSRTVRGKGSSTPSAAVE